MAASGAIRATSAERLRTTLELVAQGVPRDEIARRLGVSLNTVNGYVADPDGSKHRARLERNRGTCRRCGARTSARRNTTCRACMRRAGPPKVWTRELVIEAIRAWFLTYGEPPACRDWQPPHRGNAERRARFRRLNSKRRKNSRRGMVPTTTTVNQLFGSWNAAIEAAGFTPRVPGGQQKEPAKVCSHGHPLEGANLRVDASGQKRCRACQRRYAANSQIRKEARERGLILEGRRRKSSTEGGSK